METKQTIDRPAKLRAMIAFYGVPKGDFADAVGIKAPSLSQVLTGNENPSLALLTRMCEELSRISGKQVTIGDIWE